VIDKTAPKTILGGVQPQGQLLGPGGDGENR